MKNRVVESVLELVGSTPMVRINRLTGPDSAEVLAKLEFVNPGGSVKDRIALAMIEEAEREGRLVPGDTIVEPTSGNTGVALALVAAVKGYRLVLTMPDDISLERRNLLSLYGAELVLTPSAEGMSGAVTAAQRIAKSRGYYMAHQFSNPANPEAHRRTTAAEIVEATGGRMDAFVAGVGTGGTVTGVARALRESSIEAKVVAVEPLRSSVLSGGRPGLHRIQGIGAGFVPKVLDPKVIDEVIAVGDEEAWETARRLASEEGLLVGVSGGAALYAALEVAAELGPDKRVVVMLPDSGERYLNQHQLAVRAETREGEQPAEVRIEAEVVGES